MGAFVSGLGRRMYHRRGIEKLTLLFAIAAVATMLAAMPAAAQVPAEPPLAASSNVHVIGHVPGSAAGMTFKDHYACVSG